MPRFFVKNEQVKESTIIIIGEDIKHIKNVLRKQIGDNIEICDKDSKKSYICEIEKIGDKNILTKIIKELQSNDNKIKVDIYQGLPKADKMELIIQKSVELGANAIIPVSMKRCVVKITSKDEMKKITRWQKIAESAAKQSGRNTIPEIRNIINIEKFTQLIKEYDSVIVAYENEKSNTIKHELLNLKEKIETKYTEQNKKIESLASDKETLTDGLSKLNNSIKSMGDKIDQNTKFVGDLKQEVQGFGKIVNENKAAIQGLNTEGDIELAKPNINNDNTESSDDNMNFESIKPGTGADGVGVNEERIEVDLSISGEKESSSDDDEDLGGEN